MKELKPKVYRSQAYKGLTGAKGYRLYELLLLVLLSIATGGTAYGNVALFIEEPYGFFGSIIPMGHSAIYLNHVCAETPTTLRRCQPDEDGVVISRYSRVGELDWVAIPLMPYLYAVDRPEDVPAEADMASVVKMRQEYAERHLQSLDSAVEDYDRKNVWPQLLGAAYIRKIYSFEISTTDEQDDRLVSELNDNNNRGHFNLFTNNCADFARRLLVFYYPGSVTRSITADVAITTPKQIAKSLASYSRLHKDLRLNEIIIPQIPGTIHRSHTPRGVVESLLKTMKYAFPIAVLQPYVLAGIAATYLTRGRFNLANNAPIVPVMDQAQVLTGDVETNAKPVEITALEARPSDGQSSP
jgi:hypothetical protein